MDYTKDILMMARRVLETNLLIRERNNMEDVEIIDKLQKRFDGVLEIKKGIASGGPGMIKTIESKLINMEAGFEFLSQEQELGEQMISYWICKLGRIIEKLKEAK
jgi:hypothetical protein